MEELRALSTWGASLCSAAAGGGEGAAPPGAAAELAPRGREQRRHEDHHVLCLRNDHRRPGCSISADRRRSLTAAYPVVGPSAVGSDTRRSRGLPILLPEEGKGNMDIGPKGGGSRWEMVHTCQLDLGSGARPCQADRQKTISAGKKALRCTGAHGTLWTLAPSAVFFLGLIIPVQLFIHRGRGKRRTFVPVRPIHISPPLLPLSNLRIRRARKSS